MDTQVNNPPPLDLDLSTVDTARPLLAETIYDLRVDKVEIKKTNDQKAEMISLDLVTTAPATSKDGEQLQPGAHVFDQMMTSPTGKGTWTMVQQNLGALVQAAKFPPGSARLNNITEWVPQLTGRILRVKIGYKPEETKGGKTYRAKNVISSYMKS